jgi:hypothetical protein
MTMQYYLKRDDSIEGADSRCMVCVLTTDRQADRRAMGHGAEEGDCPSNFEDNNYVNCNVIILL